MKIVQIIEIEIQDYECVDDPNISNRDATQICFYKKFQEITANIENIKDIDITKLGKVLWKKTEFLFDYSVEDVMAAVYHAEKSLSSHINFGDAWNEDGSLTELGKANLIKE